MKLDEIERAGVEFSLVFIEASDEVILNRYNLTRRKHPLEAATLLESINKESEIMASIRERASGIIDTSDIKPKELSERLKEILMIDSHEKAINIHVQSFGFKYGIPIDLDLLFDVRFLPNPYYIEELREKTGEDAEVYDYVMKYDISQEFAERLLNMLKFLIPNFIKEGKKHLLREKTGEDAEVYDYVMKYDISQEFAERLLNMLKFLIPNFIKEGKKHLTIGIGCSGGKHRSVTFARLLHNELSKVESLNVYISHREKERRNW